MADVDVRKIARRTALMSALPKLNEAQSLLLSFTDDPNGDISSQATAALEQVKRLTDLVEKEGS